MLADVLVVFDELAAEAAARLIGGFVALSWPGGVRKLDEVDWSPLRGRLVAILPHHGAARSKAPGQAGQFIERRRQPNLRAGAAIAQLLEGYQARLLAVIDTGPPEAHPDGWSLSGALEAGWTGDQAQEWFVARIPQSWPMRKDNIAIPPGAPPEGPPPAAPPEDDLPVIRWEEGRLPQIVTEAEAALLASGQRLFQRAGAGMVVRVVRRDAPTVRHYKRPPGALGIVMVDPPYLVDVLTRVARWERWDAKAEAPRRINAPDKAALTFLSRVGEWRLPLLRGTISAPTLRPDGTILQSPGYDAATQLWYDACGIRYPPIPESPTRAAAQAALERLIDVFSTIPFKTNVDHSVALAFALTALVRRSLPSAPLGAITAPVARTGKTLIADCIAILAMGTVAPAMTLPSSDEEAEKTALAVLMEGDPVVLIDNVERPLGGDWLCTMLTSEYKSQRLLGRSEMVKVPTTTLVLATGNHLVIQGDLRARALVCRIDANIEHPERREFERELREQFMAARPELVAAGLTLMRAFIATGQSAHDQVAQWGGFEQWSAMVRAPLVWLGCDDPCDSFKELEQNDPERMQLLQMIGAWCDSFPDRAGAGGASGPATAGDAIEVAGRGAIGGASESDRRMELICLEVGTGRKSGKFDARTLGNWLRSRVDRPVDGLKLVKAGDRDHSTLWKVAKVA
jgi:hypothetical protein